MSDPMTPEVREWMKATDAEPPDAQQAARQVMSRLPEVRQRRRWWPFPVFHRSVQTPTSTDTIEYQPTPTPATNGHSTIVIGRTQTMFSPVKAFVVGALVFGGVMLIAQPFDQQGSVPGAETEAIAPTWVTGNVQPAPSCSSGDLEIDGDVRRSRNVECSPQTWTSSDPRLTGEVSRRFNEDTHQTDEGSIMVSMDAAYLRNEGGGWACAASNLLKGPEELTGTTFTCIGDGGYDGLSAILVSEPAGGNAEEFVGLIFSGDLPPLPEAPAAE